MLHFINNNKAFVSWTFAGLLFMGSIVYFINSQATLEPLKESLKFGEIFVGFATIFSAWVVLAVYFFQKWNSKVEAAQIIFLEIENAENSLAEIDRIFEAYRGDVKYVVLPTSIFVLPVNSWKAYKHLFVSNLDQNEQRAINRFFEYCSLIENTMEDIRRYIPISVDEKIRETQRQILNLIKESVDQYEKMAKESDNDPQKIIDSQEIMKKHEEKKGNMIKHFAAESYTFPPSFGILEIQEYVKSANKYNISISSVGAKLKAVANFDM